MSDLLLLLRGLVMQSKVPSTTGPLTSPPTARLLLPGKLTALALLVLVFGASFAVAGQARQIAVLPFELHDLTLNPDTASETERAASLQPLLQEYLQAHNIVVVENPASAATEAGKGAGYLFDRPAVSARIGREASVDWIVSGRLHKASFLFVYLKSQLINVNTGKVSADFVVEIKGPQKKLTHKGVETLALQIAEALKILEPIP